MKTNPDWLNEMMDAALNDSPESSIEPDFRAIQTAAANSAEPVQFRSRYHPQPRRRLFITAAAALLAFSVAIPAGIITGRQISTRKLIIEQNTLFVEELIGGTLFDEGLSPNGNEDSENWILGGNADEGFFDI